MDPIISANSPSTVEVLLSAHDGERYILTQLASILGQTHTDLRVLVRDDQSTDGTARLVREIAAEDERVRLVTGPRLGWAGSFMELLALSGDARWLAFADQDDLWLPDKLERAVAALAPLPEDQPALYGTAMLHVDDRLRRLSATRAPRRMSFENALVQNVIAGCTMVFNRAARSLCLRGASSVAAHDWWLYLVTAAFGTLIFDEAVTVLHRVHDANATALPLPEFWVRRLRTHVNLPRDQRPSGFARVFYETYGDSLRDDQRGVIEDLLSLHGASWWMRARYASRSPLYRQTSADDAIFRVLLALGRF